MLKGDYAEAMLWSIWGSRGVTVQCHEGNCILLFYPIIPYVIFDVFEAPLHIVVAGRRLFHSSRLGRDEYISFAIVSLPSTRDHLDTRHVFTYRKHVQQPFSSISFVLQPLHPSFHSLLLPSLLRSPQVAKHISPPSKLSPQVKPPPSPPPPHSTNIRPPTAAPSLSLPSPPASVPHQRTRSMHTLSTRQKRR